MTGEWTSQNYYEILDVSPNTPGPKIREAYLKAKEAYCLDSPALYKTFTEAEARQILLLIDEAYRAISKRLHDEAAQAAVQVSRPALEPLPEKSIEVFDGQILQRIRESKGVSLAEISQQTKILVAYLRAIEAEDYAELPARVFVHSYVKEIAKFLSLDMNKVVKSYMSNYKRDTVG